MNNVYKRLQNVDDAYDLHRLKRFIDENVDYGVSEGGLTGNTQRLLKGWRRAIDEALDTQFTEYNKINSVVSDLITSVDEIGNTFGKKMSLSDPLANIRAGQVTSRLLSNSPNRGEVMRAILNSKNTAQKYGIEASDDIIAQVRFADLLEDVYGTQATRSLGGRFQRGLEEFGGVAQDAAQGQPISAAVKATVRSVQAMRGISEEARKEALRSLLGIATN